MTMRFKAVLFDLDGTLLDTLQDIATSGNTALAAEGFPVHPVEAYKRFVGDGMEELVRRALPEAHRDDATVSRALKSMKQAYREHWADTTRPYPGVPEMLTGLTERHIPMAILSNKPEASTRLCAERLLAEWSFVLVRGARPEVPRKPDPTAAKRIAEGLRLQPEEVLYLGDSGTDMRTASTAGMFPAGALWGFRTAEELLQSGARALLEQPQDIIKLL
ncbi:MAG: HAD family hydrolase [Planctomycetota bacterium]